MNKNSCLFIILINIITIVSAMDSSCYSHIDRVSAETAKKIQDRYQMQQISSGLFHMGFELQRPLNEEEARYLFITISDLYINKLNDDPYLIKNCSDYPFTIENINICLYPKEYRSWTSFSPNVTNLSNYKNKISYCYRTIAERYGTPPSHNESYEEAKVILAASQFSDADLEKSMPFNKAAQTTIDRFAKEMRKKYDLEYWGAGYSPETISIQFSIFHPISVQEARKLILETTAAFIKAINQSSELIPYLDHYPFTRDDVEVGIYSHKKKTSSRRPEWPIAPDVEVVASSKDEIIYGFEDPGIENHRISETFEEAQKQLCLNTNDKVAQFAEEVSHLNTEYSIENLMKRSRKGK